LGRNAAVRPESIPFFSRPTQIRRAIPAGTRTELRALAPTLDVGAGSETCVRTGCAFCAVRGRRYSPEMTSETSGSLEIFLLGPFRCAVDGAAVEARRWLRPKPKLVVKLLALEPRHRLHRELIAERLWPSLAARAAVKSLDKAIHVARRALEPGLERGAASRFLAVEDKHVVLRAPGLLWIDAEVFERRAASAIARYDAEGCESARALYRGELLADDPYEEWAAAVRTRLRAVYADVVSTLARIHFDRDRFARSAELLEELAALEPFDEDVSRRLMLAWALDGSVHRALGEFERLADALRRDLAAEPDPETVALRDRIATGAVRAAEARADRHAETRHTLPYPVTSFVGRVREIERTRSALAAARLLTLTGPGGIGKTRLATRVAFDVLDRFPAGVWFVELAALDDGAPVAQALAAALGLHEEPGRPLESTLANFFGERAALVVLDNCEHVVASAATLAAGLLAACPGLRIVATSRERLNVAGELVHAVPVMASPRGDRPTPVDELPSFDAVKLLLDRIASTAPDFELTAENAPTVVELCERLDGIPLAIEFAAARSRLLSVEQILARLDGRFRLLDEGNRAAAPRHRTLEASMDWSYRLLAEPERAVLRRLAVFAGGLTLEAAEATCAATASAADVVGLLGSLVDKSLVIVDRRRGAPRYRLLETVRRYADERLDEAGERATIVAAHRAFYLALAEQLDRERVRSPERDWLAGFEAEHDNLRAALRSSLADGRLEEALRLCNVMARFWIVRGFFTEGLSWTERILAVTSGRFPSLRAETLALAGFLTMRLFDTERAETYLAEALALRRASGDVRGVAFALRSLGDIAENRGDRGRAEAYYRESLHLARELGEPTAVAGALYGLGLLAADGGDWEQAEGLYSECLSIYERLGDRLEVATMLGNLGEVAHRRGDLERAARLLGESQALADRIGYRQLVADTIVSLGLVAVDRGDLDEATQRFRSAIALNREFGNRPGIACSLEGLACVAGALAHADRALRLAGAAAALREALKWPLSPSEREMLDERLAGARMSVGEALAERTFDEGRAMALAEALGFALDG
jgi:predicted ATPase/DNA-binding SARP family transcriptional activator